MKLGVMIGPTSWKNLLTFGGSAIPDTDSGSLFHFPYRCIMGILDYRFTVTKLGRMTDADKVVNPQHFGRDPTDIKSILPSTSCLHSLLPPHRNPELLSRLRAPSKYPRISNRTRKYQSFISHALAHYQ